MESTFLLSEYHCTNRPVVPKIFEASSDNLKAKYYKCQGLQHSLKPQSLAIGTSCWKSFGHRNFLF